MNARPLRAAAPIAHRALLGQQRNASLGNISGTTTPRADHEYPHLVRQCQFIFSNSLQKVIELQLILVNTD
jgi:hypothetical protein